MKKILLIEDDQIFANVYRNKLVLDGFQVEIAYDGEAGMQLLRQFRPDAVILDLILPKVAGVEIIRRIRKEPDFQKLPLIVFTNTYLTSVMQEAWKAGATKCLAKATCTPRQVVGTLTEILSGNGGGADAKRPKTAPVPETITIPTVQEDDEFQAGLRKTFIESWPATLGDIRSQLHSLARADSEKGRLPHIFEMYRRVHSVTGSAGITGLLQIAHMTDALEALLKELHERPQNVNASTMRTVASAVDFLATMFEHYHSTASEGPAARVLVVEDEEISRRAVLHALEKARLKAVSVEDPLKALEMVLISKFDLVILDVGLPNMNGFELCAKLRTLPAYKKTPVVFITSLNDFESRANSTMSGGNDFIAKPFLFVELAVKALIYALRGRLPAAKK